MFVDLVILSEKALIMADEIKFYRVNEPYGCFSNFSPHPIFLDGTTWPTTEHYFQAQKFLDWQYRSQILSEKSPMIAARMGRNRSWPLRADWEQVKDDVMRQALRAKIMQHAEVRETLLATGDAIIIEHTKNDHYWADGGDGSGKNMLGQLLMEIRAELTRDGDFKQLADPLLPPWLKYPDIPRYSIGWRMGYGESYMFEWRSWYGGLSRLGKSSYQALYPEPEEWHDFYTPNEDD
jgi:ribA/ribD-fused uncharacterized protein